MAINDLPKSLIAAASDVVEQSAKNKTKLTQKVFAEGLSLLGVTTENQLTENQRKALHSWAQLEIDRRLVAESSCGCGEVEEDDMPGDSVYHKDGEEAGTKKTEIDEDDKADKDHDGDGEVETSSQEYLGSRDKAIKAAMKESIALGSDEIATNGAVAVGDASIAEPKHADVIKDSSPLTGTTEYRLLLQFATNEGTHIYPPVSLPGAPTVAALRELVEGLPYFNAVVDAALVHASTSASEKVGDLS